MSSSPSDTDPYTKVCQMVHAAHFKNGSSAEASFHIAVRKNIQCALGPVTVPKLRPYRLKVTEEWFKTVELRELVARVGAGHCAMGRGWQWRDLPVVVVRHREMIFLIDGNRRVLHRYLTGEEMTRAYVVELKGAAAIKDRYIGNRAISYEARRVGKAWWKAENEAVAAMLNGLKEGATVLDVPVGTARFVGIYQRMGLKALGIDVSSDMLKVAMNNIKAARYVASFDLLKGNVMRLGHVGRFDAVVCTRFLNWLLPDEMKEVMATLMRACKDRLIVSIEIGKRKSDMGNKPHMQRDFDAAVRAIGGVVCRTIPIEKNYSMVQIGHAPK